MQGLCHRDDTFRCHPPTRTSSANAARSPVPVAAGRPVLVRDPRRVPSTHAAERRERPVHVTEIGHLGHPADLPRGGLVDRGEDARHRVVDPHVDRPELVLDASGGLVDRRGVGDVEGEDQSLASCRLNLLGRGLEALGASRDQPERGPTACQGSHHGAPHARRGAGDNDHASVHVARSRQPQAASSTTRSRARPSFPGRRSVRARNERWSNQANAAPAATHRRGGARHRSRSPPRPLGHRRGDPQLRQHEQGPTPDRGEMDRRGGGTRRPRRESSPRGAPQAVP